jgi:hypothetical protein
MIQSLKRGGIAARHCDGPSMEIEIFILRGIAWNGIKRDTGGGITPINIPFLLDIFQRWKR